jgi:hypothetical protein
MKKLTTMIMLLLFVMLLGVSSASAIDMNNGPQTAAAYFPEETNFFLVTRTDEAFIEELETILSSVRTRLPAEIPMRGIRESLREGFAASPISYDAFMSWIGDWAAFGGTEIDQRAGGNSDGYLVIDLEDQAALEAYLTENAAELELTIDGNDYVSRSTRFTFGDGIVYLSDVDYTLPEFTSSLLDNQTFQDSVGMLAADRYNIVLYIDLAAASEMTDATQLEALGMSGDVLGGLAVGMTILDGRTLTIDIAQTGVEGAAEAVDSSFVRFIPSQTSAFIHATDFTAAFNTGADAMRNAARMQGSPDPMEQIRSALQAVGIDLDKDILSWTNGDYALLMRADISGALAGMESAMSDPMQFIDFGIVFEATDAAKAQTFVTRLNTILNMSARQNEEVSITTETLMGMEVTVVSAVVQRGMPRLDIIIGANDDIFFVANRRAAEAMLSGREPITGNVTYQQASKYFLPNPSSVWYADGNGVATTAIIPLALLGPAIGNVFDNITRELENPPSSQSQPQNFTVSNRNQSSQEIKMMRQLIGLLNSGSITSTVSGNTRLVRIALTLNLE